MKLFSLYKKLLILLALGFFLQPATFLCAQETKSKIVIVRSKDIKPYNQAVDGFKQKLSTIQVRYQEYNFEKFCEDPTEIIAIIRQEAPDLIFTVGTEASVYLAKNFTDKPMLFAMVLDPAGAGVISPLTKNVTGVTLKISIEQQFKKIKEVLPNVKKIGMLYDATRLEAVKNEAEAVAKSLELELIAKPVYSKVQIDEYLNELMDEVDCLWAAVDTAIYNAQSAQHILLTTIRHKMPFMAFSANYVNAGALMALEAGYPDIGWQTAEMALEILKGKNPSEISVEEPKKLHLIVNQKTADQINVRIGRGFLQ